MKELHLYTAQIGKYKGPDTYDITVKSGDHTFAPTWDLVLSWKQGLIDWTTYARQYRHLMLGSYKRNPDVWREMLHKGILTLLCYCRIGEHCHRHLLAEFLRKLGEKEGVCVIEEGERPLPEKDEELSNNKEDKLFQELQQNLF